MIDEIDDTLLTMHINNPPTIKEMATRVERSVSSIHDRLIRLENLMMLAKSKKGKHRSRSLTRAGIEYLMANGLYK